MKHKKLLEDVPKAGDAVLVTPRADDDALARVLVLAVMSLADVLRYQPPSFMFRFVDGRRGVVFSEPAPRPVIELLVDLLEATESSVRLEKLKGLLPVLRLSHEGIRVYRSLEGVEPDSRLLN